MYLRDIGIILFILACTMRAMHSIFRQLMKVSTAEQVTPVISLYSVVQILGMALPQSNH